MASIGLGPRARPYCVLYMVKLYILVLYDYENPVYILYMYSCIVSLVLYRYIPSPDVLSTERFRAEVCTISRSGQLRRQAVSWMMIQ